MGGLDSQRSRSANRRSEAFDVVVVGGGAAGCVVAARLAESGSRSVLLLEAVGLPSVEDPNSPGAVGAGRMPMNSRDGRRVTTADAILPVGKTPPNLVVPAAAQVADIVFDRTRAGGIRLLDGAVIEAGW